MQIFRKILTTRNPSIANPINMIYLPLLIPWPVSSHSPSNLQHLSGTIGFRRSYFFIGYMLPDVITFIIVVLFGALDFWVVKNVTGRLLVGLRWWTDFDQEGKETWKYESYDREYITNKVDVAFFWTSQISGTIVWVVFLLLSILSLSIFWVRIAWFRVYWFS